jgi:extracellular factor (EF) 3-hydroxypalmitic acid methyl ester biosynthesis protein
MDATFDLRHIAGAPAADRAATRLCPEYREVVDRTVDLLLSTKARLHAPAPRGPGEGTAREIRATTLDLWKDWRLAWAEAADCLPEIAGSSDQLRLAKDYTEAHLTPELMAAPVWRQAYTKPLGYPGDYVVMNYMYHDVAVGDTQFGEVVQQLAVQIGRFVVKRKDFVRQTIGEVAARNSGARPCVVASLGCGPAREIAEYLQLEPHGSPPMHFVLVDQDSDALRFAGRRLGEITSAARRGTAAHIELRHLSVLRLLREVDPASLLPRADLIYSAGLFDYFSDRTCHVLTRRLFDALRPGGLLLLGNMKAGTDMLWPLELIADWSLHYRSAESVLSWTDGLPGAEICLRTEATGYDYLVSVRKA